MFCFYYIKTEQGLPFFSRAVAKQRSPEKKGWWAFVLTKIGGPRIVKSKWFCKFRCIYQRPPIFPLGREDQGRLRSGKRHLSCFYIKQNKSRSRRSLGGTSTGAVLFLLYKNRTAPEIIYHSIDNQPLNRSYNGVEFCFRSVHYSLISALSTDDPAWFPL